MSFYIYAETAFHHEGDKEYLIRLVDEAKRAGVNGIKFQVLTDLDQLMSPRHSSYELAKSWVLPFSDWKEVFEHAKNLDLDIILMPIDPGAFDLVAYFDIKYIEIHSVSFKDKVLFDKLDEYSIPLIFGVGGRTLEEIDEVVNKYKSREISLMVGFQSYPSQLDDVKLGRINELGNMYPDCTIGYADHSSYDDVMALTSNEYAYILGARLFEKHITLDEGDERIDFQSAINAEKLTSIITRLSFLDKLLSIDKSDLFNMSDNEVVYRNRQKLPVAKHNLKIDHIISSIDLELRMIDSKYAIDDAGFLIGQKLRRNINAGSAFVDEDFQ